MDQELCNYTKQPSNARPSACRQTADFRIWNFIIKIILVINDFDHFLWPANVIKMISLGLKALWLDIMLQNMVTCAMMASKHDSGNVLR